APSLVRLKLSQSTLGDGQIPAQPAKETRLFFLRHNSFCHRAMGVAVAAGTPQSFFRANSHCEVTGSTVERRLPYPVDAVGVRLKGDSGVEITGGVVVLGEDFVLLVAQLKIRVKSFWIGTGHRDDVTSSYFQADLINQRGLFLVEFAADFQFEVNVVNR